MLRPSLVAFVVFIWLAGSIFGAVMEGHAQSGEAGMLIGTQDQETVLNRLLFWQEIQTEQTWGFFTVVGAVPGFFGALFDMFTFNFSFLQTDWGIIFRLLIFSPFIAMIVYGLIMTVISIFQAALN
jgi:hypothetical protein